MTLPLVSPFQKRVYRVLMRVPRGRVITYAALADAVGCRSAQAVGQALKRNPYAPAVPCHRVIASDLTPGGYRGVRRVDRGNRKLTLLAAEGVRFVNGRLADPSRLFTPPVERCRWSRRKPGTP